MSISEILYQNKLYMQNKILELAKSYKEELLRKNEMEYATKKPAIASNF